MSRACRQKSYAIGLQWPFHPVWYVHILYNTCIQCTVSATIGQMCDWGQISVLGTLMKPTRHEFLATFYGQLITSFIRSAQCSFHEMGVASMKRSCDSRAYSPRVSRAYTCPRLNAVMNFRQHSYVLTFKWESRWLKAIWC